MYFWIDRRDVLLRWFGCRGGDLRPPEADAEARKKQKNDDFSVLCVSRPVTFSFVTV